MIKLTAALAVVATACATATAPDNQPAAIAPASNTSPDCVTWQTYRTRDTTLPDLPSGFEQGCLFTAAGPSPSDLPPIYILQNGVDLSAIAAVAPASTEGDPPQIQLRPDLSPRFLQSDAVVTYSRACTLIDPSRHRNCDNPPTYQAYLVTAAGTVCFQHHCLRAPATSTELLLALWGAPLPDPIALPSADRRQYAPVPLAAALANVAAPETSPFSETIFGQSIVAYSPWAIALRTYGRTALGEGQYPTVVTEVTGEGGPAVVVTNFGAPDDAIGGWRYWLDFESLDGNKFGLTAAGSQQYCRRSTPPQWTTALCP